MPQLEAFLPLRVETAEQGIVVNKSVQQIFRGNSPRRNTVTECSLTY
ncbi:MAG: hypothetical protein ACXW04_11450 [Methylobacter sp.]